MKRFLSPYPLCLMVGMSVGIAFGGRIFPVFEHYLGEVMGEVILGIGGAMLAAVAYEIAAFVRRQL
jgi:hypothetical protein